MQNVVPIVIVHGLEQVFEHQRLKCRSNERVIFVTMYLFQAIKIILFNRDIYDTHSQGGGRQIR